MNGIVAQRLVRVTCSHCSLEKIPDIKTLRLSGLEPEAVKKFTFRVGPGCGHCRGTGFKGRKAIAEILDLNDEIRELIVARAPTRVIKEAATRNGTRFLREAAVAMVARGDTTLEEINRVTFVV
jgi:general secretion pathway protein E